MTDMRTSNPLYLYCIRPKTRVHAKFSARGIDKKLSAFALPYRDIEAVVSRLGSKDRNWQEFAKRAGEDLVWIKKMAEIHEAVVEKATGLSGKQGLLISVIPMKFGTIFKNEDNLKASLAKHYLRFKTSLKKIEGKQEWHLKIYLSDEKGFRKMLRLQNNGAKKKEKEMSSMNEGKAYFAEKEIETILSRMKESELKKANDTIFQSMAPHAESGVQKKLLAKELTGRADPMIFNGAFLVKREKLSDFKNAAKGLTREFPAFDFLLIGPWPPYTFV